MKRETTLLFDLDGTLSDSRPGILACIRHALGGMGAPLPSDETLSGWIGVPLRPMFAALVPGASDADVEAAVGRYRERYDASGLYDAALYEGVLPMLDAARAEASRLYVATAKPHGFAVRVLEHLGIARYFDGVCGPGLDGHLDAKAHLIGHLLRTDGVTPADAVMVGDRAGDVFAARANGIPTIGVLWGYGSERELIEAGAAALCAHPGELVACVASLRTPRDASRRGRAAFAGDRSIPAAP